MGPGSEVTFFLAATSDSTLSIPNQSKKFSISVIALFDNGHVAGELVEAGATAEASPLPNMCTMY